MGHWCTNILTYGESTMYTSPT